MPKLVPIPNTCWSFFCQNSKKTCFIWIFMKLQKVHFVWAISHKNFTKHFSNITLTCHNPQSSTSLNNLKTPKHGLKLGLPAIWMHFWVSPCLFFLSTIFTCVVWITLPFAWTWGVHIEFCKLYKYLQYT